MSTTLDLRSRLQAALGEQYRIESELGHGGMGVVFLATDTALDRPVAVKVVHPDLAVHGSITRRFAAEGRMIARLRHPNIVSIHTAGETTGLFYYIMDYVPGESLRQRLNRERRLDPAAAAAILADLADGLDAAGRAGLVHRDVKPENVLLDSATGRALLADFGIARIMASDAAEGVTAPSLVVGTPTYMSPEQAAGDSVDPRSDLYGLGVLGYEMLAGHPPFRGSNSSAVVSMHLSEAPPPLSPLRPDAPPSLVAAIMRALAKDPADRWQTGADLRGAILSLPGAARAELPAGARRGSRRRWAALTALALLAAGTSVAVATLHRSGPPEGVNPRHSILVLPFDNLRRDPSTDWLREGAVNMLALNLSQWNDLTVVDHERLHDLFAKENIRPEDAIGLEMARTLARDAGVWTVVLGDITQNGESLQVTARVYDVATGARVDVAKVEGRSGPDVRPVFDQLAAKLLNLSGAPGGIRADVAGATTVSLEAYRSYLAGLDKLNRWDLVGAERDLSHAVAVDSTFGLAYYKLALTRGWIVGPKDSIESDAIVKASRHSDPLPVRDQTVIKAYRAFIEGNYDASRALYRGLVAKDSADADAWYGLGDVQYHDTSTVRRGTNWTQSLRAFKRALALDPSYYLAYEHTSWLLNRASRSNPELVLLPGDSIALVHRPDGKQQIDSGQIDAAVRRARVEAVAEAQQWVASQPETPRAHNALIEAHLAAQNYPAALAEVDRLGQAASASTRPTLPFIRARVELAAGRSDAAEATIRAVVDSSKAEEFAAETPHDLFNIVAAATNAFSMHGHLSTAVRVVDLAADVHDKVFASMSGGKPWDSDPGFWKRLTLAHLYGASGAPETELRRIWYSAAEAGRRAPATRRGEIARTGWPAALALYTEWGDTGPLKELQAITGEVLPKEIRAILAAGRSDSGAARRILDEPRALDSSWQDRPYWSFYRAPTAAKTRFLIGDYRETIDLLKDFDPAHLETAFADPRWGLLGRVRLLRGLAYEKLGQLPQAQQEFRGALELWKSADPGLEPYVNKARLGLARVSGSG